MDNKAPAFVAIKWGDAFDPSAVNILKRAALAQCSQAPRFVCLTNDGRGLDDDIEVYPIPEFDLYRDTPRAGIWPKISLFHPSLQRVLERVVFLDLDTVVTGPLDDLFDDPGRAIRMLSCGQRWRQLDESFTPEAATGVMTYNLSQQVYIFEIFARNPKRVTDQFPLEQQFVGATAHELQYYSVEWIESFKYHLRRPPLVDLFFAPRAPGPHTRLVAFHGYPRPVDVATRGNRWARAPRSGRKKPRWLIDYFAKYSDQTQ